MENENKQVDNRTATQKITDLENGLMSLYPVIDNLARDVMTCKDAIKLLGNKVDSMVQASENGEQVTNKTVSRIMIENNCKELSQRVDALVQQGVLTTQEQVSADSFVVGSEIDEEGGVVNPRLQFVLSKIDPKLQEKIIGAKRGDILTLEEGKLKFQVIDTYSTIPTPAAASTEEENQIDLEPSNQNSDTLSADNNVIATDPTVQVLES